MGKVFERIDETLQAFISQQPLFFVATAPLKAEGHVNLSPKGMDSFRVLSDQQVAYLDLTGSGNETSAHLAENGRITFMFCAFTGAPNIVRLYGTGRVILPNHPDWQTLVIKFPAHLSTRQIIVADIARVSTSCGYAVPFMDYRGERETLSKYWEVKGADALSDYWTLKNSTSIDGLQTPLGVSLSADNTES